MMGQNARIFSLAATVALVAAVGSTPAAHATEIDGAAVLTTPAAHATEIDGAAVLRYSFDQRTPSDESGHGHALTTRAVRGGSTLAVAHGAGNALRFPKHCSERRCPRIVLQTASTDELNPGTAPFRYGATVLLPKKQTTRGQNVLQKGYSHTGGQYKLQIDGKAGRPSCVLVGTGRHVIHQARSATSVADGAWHSIECRRAGAVLSVVVDGVVSDTTAIPATLSVANGAPLSIGGKGAYADNDQFQGTLDDLWVARG